VKRKEKKKLTGMDILANEFKRRNELTRKKDEPPL